MIKCIEMSGQFGGDIQYAARARNRKFGTVWKFQPWEEEILHWSPEGGVRVCQVTGLVWDKAQEIAYMRTSSCKRIVKIIRFYP